MLTRRIEKLQTRHAVDAFDCGNEPLTPVLFINASAASTDWLLRYGSSFVPLC